MKIKLILAVALSLLVCNTVYADEARGIETTPIELPKGGEFIPEETVYPGYHGDIEIIPIELPKGGEFIPKETVYPSIGNEMSRMITGAGADLVEETAGKRDYPASTVVYIEAETVQGDVYECGGVLIGPDTVLTCAHFMFDKEQLEGVNGDVINPIARDIHSVKVYTNYKCLKQDSSLTKHIHYSGEYSELAKDIRVDLTSGNPTEELKDEFVRLNKFVEHDYAILKLDKPLGNTAGWMGLKVLETTGGQKWGTLYQYPYHMPKLPSLSILVEALESDAKENNYNKESTSRLGKYIDVFEVLEGNTKDAYSKLFELNNAYSMYKSDYHIGYSQESQGQLAYNISADARSSGSPVITSEYNHATGEYEKFVCGIHSGYGVAGDSIPINSKGDAALYIKDSLGFLVDFNYDHTNDEKNKWRVAYDMYGYNRAMAVSPGLIDYLEQQDLSTCIGYNPYE